MGRSLCIAGPTAAGKSAVALEWALANGAVVASFDAFQIYKGLDIGTGKAPAADRARVEHALLDLVDPCEPFSVADYLEAARSWAGSRTGPMVWVGGTGLYFRALREGLSPAPATDPQVLAVLEREPFDDLVREIRAVDPEWSAMADLKNPRRVLRALAVFRQTGRPISEWQKVPGRPVLADPLAVVLEPDPAAHREAVIRRVEAMWTAGWPEEVARLLALPGWESSQSARALGYAEVAACLRGQCSPEECRHRIVTSTLRYAKRQLTWFRAEHNVHFIKITNPDSTTRGPRELAEHIRRLAEASLHD
jgi:tRNA dimethylallyltransferase